MTTFGLRVIADVIALRDVQALTPAQCQQIVDFIRSDAAKETLKEFDESGCSVEDATELFTFMAGVH